MRILRKTKMQSTCQGIDRSLENPYYRYTKLGSFYETKDVFTKSYPIRDGCSSQEWYIEAEAVVIDNLY